MAGSYLATKQWLEGAETVNHDRYDDDYLAEILKTTRTIALLGASPKPERPSYGVMRFLLAKGYTVYPVNPGQAGKEILGQRTYATLADVPQPIDMIDVFRAPEYLDGVVEEALALKKPPRFIWAQLGVRDDKAAKKGEAGGIELVMNRCPAIEHPRLIG